MTPFLYFLPIGILAACILVFGISRLIRDGRHRPLARSLFVIGIGAYFIALASMGSIRAEIASDVGNAFLLVTIVILVLGFRPGSAS